MSINRFFPLWTIARRQRRNHLCSSLPHANEQFNAGPVHPAEPSHVDYKCPAPKNGFCGVPGVFHFTHAPLAQLACEHEAEHRVTIV